MKHNKEEASRPDYHLDHYPKAVYALDGGHPVEGICNSPSELQDFQNAHSLVQMYPISSVLH